MSKKPTNRQVGGLEKAVREAEATDTRLKFRKEFNTLFSNCHSGTWVEGFTYEDFKKLQELGDKYLEHIAIPVAEEKAIKEFISTYAKIVQEFPALIEGAVEDAVFDERQNNGN